MRLNFNYTAASPNSRNDFIDAVSSQKEVIVINHYLLKTLTKEINSQLSSKKQGGFFKKLAIPMAILSLTNPVGWVLSGITYLCGICSSASDDLKKYVIYSGTDTSGNNILILHHKQKVDRSHDAIIYPSYVKDVDYKKTNKHVKSAK